MLVGLELLLSGAMLKFPPIAKLVSGSPIPIIRDGVMDAAALRKLRMTVEDLDEALRQQDVFDIREVQYAIAETNGHISVYRYNASDMPVVVVSDGNLCAWGMKLCGLSEEALDRYLQKKKCAQQDVFLLTATKHGPLHLLTYTDVKGGVS